MRVSVETEGQSMTRFTKPPFKPTLVKQYMVQFAESYGLVNRAKPIKYVISMSESHSPAPHVVYMHNCPVAAPTPSVEPTDARDYRMKRPDPNKMCF